VRGTDTRAAPAPAAPAPAGALLLTGEWQFVAPWLALHHLAGLRAGRAAAPAAHGGGGHGLGVVSDCSELAAGHDTDTDGGHRAGCERELRAGGGAPIDGGPGGVLEPPLMVVDVKLARRAWYLGYLRRHSPALLAAGGVPALAARYLGLLGRLERGVACGAACSAEARAAFLALLRGLVEARLWPAGPHGATRRRFVIYM
jgi:hypothetical protein